MLSVDAPLLFHARQVLVAVHQGCRDQPHYRPLSSPQNPEMLDVNAALSQAEVGLVIASANRKNLMVVERLVLVLDAVLVEPICDL